MQVTFYAKSSPIETIQEHTKQLIDRYEKFKARYADRLVIIHDRDWELLRLAVQYHDIGKYDLMFQNKIRSFLKLESLEVSCLKETRHNYVSVMGIPVQQLGLDKDEERILLQAVGYHHERVKLLNNDELLKVRDVYVSNVMPLQDTILNELNLQIECNPLISKLNVLLPEKRITADESQLFQRYVMIKGLLHRLDHAASAHVDIELAIDMNIDKFVNEFISRKYNGHKRELQLFAEQHRNNHVVIVGQTGMGKTEAGLLWLGDEKGFYTLPLRVSLNAMYKRIVDPHKIAFSQITDDGEGATGLLHSTSIDVLEDSYEGKDEVLEKVYAQSRQFSNKLIITTIDQILKFPFYYLGFEKEFATLAGNKIIIDELQAYDPRIAALIVRSLIMIDEIGGSFMIMTATLPDIYYKTLLRKLQFSNREVVTGTFIHDNLLRHHVELRSVSILDEGELAEIVHSGKQKKVLVICNTIKRAKAVYRELVEDSEVSVKLLHAKFIRRDRERWERKLLEFAEKDVTGIWVTTQLVEASLDIDFDILYSEMSPLDSQFQRYGRINRKGTKSVEEVNIIIYKHDASGIGKQSVYHPEIYERSRSLLSSELMKPSILLESTKNKLISELYNEEALKGTEYKRRFDETLKELENWIMYETKKNEAQELLRNINEVQAIPSCFKGSKKIEGALNQWKQAKNQRERRKARSIIEQYTVGVNKYAAKNQISPFPLIKDLYYVQADYDRYQGIDIHTYPPEFY